MPQLFYNFCFPDGDGGFVNHGFYYLSQKENLIYSHTEFNTPEGPYQNIFQIKYGQNRVFAYKHNEGDWVDVEVGHYPTSAYPLLLPKLLPKATAGTFSYKSVSEDTGEVVGEVVLELTGNEITETIKSKVMRRFIMNPMKAEKLDAIPISIDWGGATSFLCNDEVEAVKGTNITISKDILSR